MGLPGQTNVPIAAAITAYSRMLINEFKLLAMDLGLDLYYSDTDSLVVNGALPEQYIDSATLGQLKLEHVLEEGYFVAPKVYWLKINPGLYYLHKAEVIRSHIDLGHPSPLDKVVTKWNRSLI